MARMSIDDKLCRDPRAIRLGRIYGWRRQEAVGRLVDVFAVTYDRVSDVLLVDDIDIAAEQEGFAESMCFVGLAEKTSKGIRIKGAKERIRYLRDSRESGRIGGVKSGESRRKRSEGKSKRPFDVLRSDPSKQPEGYGNPNPNVPDPVPDSPPDPVPDIREDKEPAGRTTGSLALSVVGPARKRTRRDKLFSCTDEERAMARRVLEKLSARNSISYSGCDDHLRLIVGRHRDGTSELNMRKVIAFVAESKSSGGKGWEDDANMRQYLSPETLFGPKTISRYLEPAIAWAAKFFPDERKLEVVK